MRVAELFKFMKERHSIYEQRNARPPREKPWTSNPILQQYRFCNVYRELDTQTIWFANNWRKRYEDNDDLWFASLMFRFINWHETADLIWRPLPWDADMFYKAIEEREDQGKKVYSGAYMISTHGVREKKSTYLANSLDNIWQNRKEVRFIPGEDLNTFHQRLMKQFDVGSFLAAQVVADCKYAGKMKHAPDWWTFAASGPGSKRGLSRVFNYPVTTNWREEEWRSGIKEVCKQLERWMRDYSMPMIHAQDVQNCLCEFDKYERVRLGEGRPKSRYNGGAQ